MKKWLGLALLLAICADGWTQGGTETGRVLWKHRMGGQLWTPLVHDAGTLFLGSDNTEFYAFDLEQRAVKWRFVTGARIRSGAALTADRVFFASDDGSLYALDRENGTLKWRFDLESGSLERRLPALGPPYAYDYLHSGPVYAAGTIYIGSASGDLYAVNALTGAELWRFGTGGSIRSTPLVEGGIVYFGSWDGHTYAVDAATGDEIWRFDTGGIVQSSPASGDGKIYISSRSAQTFALDAKTGEPQWTYRYTDGSWVESSAVYRDGGLYVGSSDAGKLRAFDADSGKVLWRFATKGWSWGTPMVDGDSVYIGSISAPSYVKGMQAGFYAVDRLTGQEQWRFAPAMIEGFIEGGVFSTIVANGALYVAALDGYLYALEGVPPAVED
jgi:eukaryotic-like serine/threonine-protein kinase